VFHRLQVGDEIFDSEKAENRSFCFTVWLSNEEPRCFASQIVFFMECFIHMEDHPEISGKYMLAFMRYFKPYQSEMKAGHPMDVDIFDCTWNLDNHFAFTVDSIVPVQRIICSFLPVFRFSSVSLFTACPLQRRICF
jgi:hypothetical protein